MAKAPGGSFIPKRSSGKVAPARPGRRIYVFSYIAYIFFFGTLLSVGGIFFLNQQAERQLAEHIDLLQEERQAFRQGQLDEVRQLDMRLELAERILDRHAAPSVIFDELEPSVVESVQFTSFSYGRSDDGGITLSLGGRTESFDILLFQREVIEESTLLSAANLVSVQYGGGTNQIEGANRGPQQTNADQEDVETQVTFTFEDAAILEQIGYQPRSGAARPQQENTNDTTGATDTENTAADEGVTSQTQ